MSSRAALKGGIDKLRATVTDGRTGNVRHRQNELYKLHAELRARSEPILSALRNEAECPTTTAETEVSLTMDAVRKVYEALDFDQSIKDEYLVKEGKENLSRRVGTGLIAIRPTRHTRFYSIMTPLVVAIAAGNCILLELETPRSPVDSIIADIISSALDRDTIFISDSKLQNDEIGQLDLFVDQTNTSSTFTSYQLVSSPNGRALAVVDRTADIGQAAKAITTARLPPYHTSPYAPDLVAVNNFVIDAFIEACLEVADTVPSASQEGKSFPDDGLAKLIKDTENGGKAKVHVSNSSRLNIIVLQDRSSPLLTRKISGSYLIVLPTTSTTDAITSQFNSPTHLATYNFAVPSLAKFLSQSLSTDASFANHIPLPLLYGPASPCQAIYSLSLHPRYTTEMFSVPRPEFVTEGPLPRKEEVTKELKPTGQKKGYAVGYFEQGILIGLGLTASVVLPIVSWGVWKAGKESWKLVGRWR